MKLLLSPLVAPSSPSHLKTRILLPHETTARFSPLLCNMFARPPLAAVKEEANAPNVPMLMNSLKAAVQNAEELLSREEKLKREIEGKNREIQSLKAQLSEKVKECGELKESASRLREERDGLNAKLKENEDNKIEIIELKRKNCDLECARLRAQTDVDVYKSRFKELEGRVLVLEKEFLEMAKKAEKRIEPVDLVTENDGFVNVPAEPIIAEKRKGSEDFAKSEVLSETNEIPTAGSSHGKRSENIVVIIDSDDECASDESANEFDKAHPGKNVVENEQRVHKRKFSGLDNESKDVDDNFETGKGKNMKVEDRKANAHPREHTTQNFKSTEKVFVSPYLIDDDSSSSSSSDDEPDHSNFISSLRPGKFV